MSEQVFLTHGGQQLGPYTLDQVRAMVTQRQVSPEMLCWHANLAQWTPLGTAYPDLFQAAAAPAPAPAPAPVPAPAPAPAPAAAAGPSTVEFEILKRGLYTMPKITLQNAEVILESGALHYLQGSIQIEAQMPSAGGFIKAKLTGEKAVRPRYRGTGVIFVEPTFGECNVLELHGDTWILDKGAFMASETTVQVGMFTNKAMTGLFAGEGFFQTQVSGHGKVVYHSQGPVERVDLQNDTLVVDGSFAVARSASIEYAVERATKGFFRSMASGEGLVNTFRGTGTVLIAPVANQFVTVIEEFGGLRHLIAHLGKG